LQNGLRLTFKNYFDLILKQLPCESCFQNSSCVDD